MADFFAAIPVILEHEGSAFVNDPADPGGATRWGITLRTLRRVRPKATVDDVLELSREEATGIYLRLYWRAADYEGIVDQDCATKAFDAAVNMGVITAGRLAQEAARSCGHWCAVDGHIGPKSVAAINACQPRAWLLAMGAAMASRYREIATARPVMKRFLFGWLKRAAWPYRIGPTEIT
jgi:lysozyme family protein